ncbi:hypothetical protein [Streptococcus himalayensis]|uniref:Uncharacterized protein n=1 Tax=Streptococcus himalayensis TaxID=1888195 RepID=A0A917A2A5_9STRE|nr:hypothetical protein [Streptococcus himalayensis]GGE23268.1 hypothetical protein GCM10011510_00390 [Streptococcus himalayensis]
MKSHFAEVIVLGEFPSLIQDGQALSKADLLRELASVLDMTYLNGDGQEVQSRVFELGGIQECLAKLALLEPVAELYEFFYFFDKKVSKEEFLERYFFDDLEGGCYG